MSCPAFRRPCLPRLVSQKPFIPHRERCRISFSSTKEEALQTSLRYDLIYAQLGYVCIVIPDLPHP